MLPYSFSQQVDAARRVAVGSGGEAERAWISQLTGEARSPPNWERLTAPEAWRSVSPVFPLAARVLLHLANPTIFGADLRAFLLLLPVLKDMAKVAESGGQAEAGELWRAVGEVLQARADFQGAGEAFARALRIDEDAFGPGHSLVSRDLSLQALNLRERGAPQDALPLQQRALESAGADSLAQVRALYGLGMTYLDLGDLEEAREKLEEAVSVAENSLGEKHPELATCLDGLGVVLRDQGELDQARIYLERALVMDEAAFGPSHPSVARDSNDLGVILQSLGDHPSAMLAYERAYAIDTAAFGEDHPNVARDLANISEVHRSLGDYPAAREATGRALQIFQAVHGNAHPVVGIVLNNLGHILQLQRDLAGAKDAFDRALVIQQRHFGPNHLNVALVLGNLGAVLLMQGKLMAARFSLDQALRVA